MTQTISIRRGVRVDLDHEGVWQGRQFYPLPARTFRIMEYLIRHRDHVIPQSALLAVGWPDEPRVGQDLYRHIHRIRELVEVNPNRPQYLLTRKDRGYVLMTTPLIVGEYGGQSVARTGHSCF